MSKEQGGRGKIPKKGRTKRYFDASCGRSQKSFTVLDVGCEGHEKKFAKDHNFHPLLKKSRGDIRLVLSSHNRKGRNCKRMNGARNGSFVGARQVITSADIC